MALITSDALQCGILSDSSYGLGGFMYGPDSK